ncbi:hypothetical protein CYMTET_18207 [Cymbomonas tetramitiformis]|uniref:Photosystem I reaction center subunit XI, chloroplastic n=1 Tax=Cymbomonas tetramitiformis TaxID=36881 RepID=A0AAE0L656_9CHLO|nr:hypothetical protein CYMTET_18207 [Cymbomonas tetramitiformis]|eukprot:gene20487-24548_t
MQTAMSSSVIVPRASVQSRTVSKNAAVRSRFMGKGVVGLFPQAKLAPAARASVVVKAEDKASVIQPLNGDPFVGMLETPVTSAPVVSGFLSNLPAYRTGVSPVVRGVEVGLAHGFFLAGPFIKLGPLRATDAAEVAGCLSGAGLVVILTLCLSIYGASTFQSEETLGKKTLTGRELAPDALQTAEGWNGFSSGWLVGGLSGVAWAYLLTQTLPYYS